MPISVEDLSTLDWSDLDDVQSRGGEVLDWLLRDDLALASLFQRFREDPDLQALSNVNRAGKKLALYDDPTNGVRLRLHVFEPGYSSTPRGTRRPSRTRSRSRQRASGSLRPLTGLR